MLVFRLIDARLLANESAPQTEAKAVQHGSGSAPRSIQLLISIKRERVSILSVFSTQENKGMKHGKKVVEYVKGKKMKKRLE